MHEHDTGGERFGSGAQAAEWDARYGERDDAMWSGRPNGRLVAEVSDLDPGRALDVGCGEGGDAIWLAQRGWTVTAIDISDVALRRAQTAAEAAGTAVEWICRDALQTALPARSFGLVSLQYPALPKAAGEDAVRKLLDTIRPDGLLLAVYHDLDHDHYEHMKSRGIDPADYVGVDDLVRLVGDEFTIELHAFEPRVDPPPGTEHIADVVLRAPAARVTRLETDYLVVGAGATGMAFVDALIAETDADVVMVDRRHGAGGHWLDAYPFVRLHQPSANYGVTSRVLGNDRVDDAGPNAGFYERSTAAEICDYFNRVLDETLLASGRVRFFPMSDYRGAHADGHHFVSLLTGAETTVHVRRKLVDATYIESSIPSRHTPRYEIDDGVRVIPPNDLVHLGEPTSGFTIIGAGKTAMDTCTWLLDAGVDPNDIRWIRPRDGWFFNRAFFQPLDLVASYMTLQASWVASAAACTDATDFAHRLEADGAMIRVDPDVEPGVFRGATLSRAELDALRSVENVVRRGRVRRVATDRIMFDDGDLAADATDVYIDCTAEGLRPVSPRPVFEPDRITMQFVTIGIAPWSAATVAMVEALADDDSQKNSLCPPVTWTGDASSMLPIAHTGMTGLMARSAVPELAAWTEERRLNPARGAAAHADEPEVQAAFASMATNLGPALENLARHVA